MEDNILDYTLNATFDIFRLFKVAAVWFILWHLVIKRILRRCKVTSFWYEMYEVGAFGTLGIVILLSIVTILLIASIQTVIGYGVKMLAPLLFFWGIITTIVILIIKSIRKKK